MVGSTAAALRERRSAIASSRMAMPRWPLRCLSPQSQRSRLSAARTTRPGCLATERGAYEQWAVRAAGREKPRWLVEGSAEYRVRLRAAREARSVLVVQEA